MTSDVTAADWAVRQAASVRDDPAGRMALMERCHQGPFGEAPQHLPFCRAGMSLVRRQLRRGVLHPGFADRPGSPRWRAVNERILRDGCAAVGLSGGFRGGPRPPRSTTGCPSTTPPPPTPGTGRTTGRSGQVRQVGRGR